MSLIPIKGTYHSNLFIQEFIIVYSKTLKALYPTAIEMLNFVWTGAKDLMEMKYNMPSVIEYLRGIAGCFVTGEPRPYL